MELEVSMQASCAQVPLSQLVPPISVIVTSR